MLDIQRLRKQLDEVEAILAKRGFEFPRALFIELEEKRRDAQIQSEEIQAERKKLSKLFGQKKAQGEDTAALALELDKLGKNLEHHAQTLETVQIALQDLLLRLPNLPDESVPIGKNEEDNLCIHTIGTPPHIPNSQDHTNLAAPYGMDFESAASMAGARFVVLRGKMATLHRALVQFMLHEHLANGYEELYLPLMLRGQALQNTGQLPKFEEDLFKVPRDVGDGEESFYLIPTAEVPITNLVAQKILHPMKELKFVAHTPCFRSEAGSHGRDTKGLIRQHQFDKVELVHITTPEQSMDALENMTQQAENILKKLNLPFRRMLLCTGDMGFGSCKTYDLEVWIPSQNTYREISSCSNMGDFQARRMQARYKNAQGQIQFVHTLNGSALAVGRTLVAVLENHQQENGSIKIPEILQAYCGFDTLSINMVNA